VEFEERAAAEGVAPGSFVGFLPASSRAELFAAWDPEDVLRSGFQESGQAYANVPQIVSELRASGLSDSEIRGRAAAAVEKQLASGQGWTQWSTPQGIRRDFLSMQVDQAAAAAEQNAYVAAHADANRPDDDGWGGLLKLGALGAGLYFGVGELSGLDFFGPAEAISSSAADFELLGSSWENALAESATQNATLSTAAETNIATVAGESGTFAMPAAVPELPSTLQSWGLTETAPGLWTQAASSSGFPWPSASEAAAKILSGAGSVVRALTPKVPPSQVRSVSPGGGGRVAMPTMPFQRESDRRSAPRPAPAADPASKKPAEGASLSARDLVIIGAVVVVILAAIGSRNA
jgi:hypothetical protein